MGPLRVSAQKAAGRMSAPKMARPDSTVASHAPSAPTVPSSEHARQMAAAMRDAMPSGLVHSTAVTMRLITALNACGAKSKKFACHVSTGRRLSGMQCRAGLSTAPNAADHRRPPRRMSMAARQSHEYSASCPKEQNVLGDKRTLMRLMRPSACSPSWERQRPKKSEKVITPRMFMLTAAATTLSGTALRATTSSACSGEPSWGATLCAAACAANT